MRVRRLARLGADHDTGAPLPSGRWLCTVAVRVPDAGDQGWAASGLSSSSHLEIKTCPGMRPGAICSRLRAWNFVHPAAYRVVADKTKTAVCSNAILQFWLPRTAGHSRGTNVCERELSQRPVGTSPPNPTPPAGRRARSRVSAAPDLIQGQSSEQRPRFTFLISRVCRREGPTPPGSRPRLAM
jgi:hypothetical protein